MTEAGEVFTAANAELHHHTVGQTEPIESSEDEDRFLHVPIPDSVQDIACGDNHTVAITGPVGLCLVAAANFLGRKRCHICLGV